MNPYLSYAIAFLVFLNMITFLVFGIDKKKSLKGKRRIKESTLLFLAFTTPVGALAGMKYFKHKTQKNKFRIGISIFLLIHICMLPIVLLIFKKFF